MNQGKLVREIKRMKRGGFADKIFWIGNEE